MAAEDLHVLQPSGTPPHTLRLKVGMLCLLMRNMRPKLGLVNGRRVRIVAIRDSIIDVEIVGGQHNGGRAYIPRITFIDTKSYCFVFKRLQVPPFCFKIPTCSFSVPAPTGLLYDGQQIARTDVGARRAVPARALLCSRTVLRGRLPCDASVVREGAR